MAFRFKITPLAAADIDFVLKSLSADLLNPSAAQKLYSALRKEIESACLFPLSNPDCAIYLIENTNIRHAAIRKYEMIYEVDQNREEIRVLRFVYGRMDLTDLALS